MNTYQTVSEAVAAISEPFRVTIEKAQADYRRRALMRYWQLMPEKTECDKAYRLMRDNHLTNALHRLVTITNDYPQYSVVVPDVDNVILKLAKRESDEIIASFRAKMSAKLEGLIPAGQTASITVIGSNPYSNTLRFVLSGGGAFTLENSIVTSWGPSSHQPFYRYPSTFHNASMPDGSKIAKPCEASVKQALAGIDTTPVVDPNLCPGSGKPWYGAKPYGRSCACPVCGQMMPYQTLRGRFYNTVRKHNRKEM